MTHANLSTTLLQELSESVDIEMTFRITWRHRLR
jgi:hypothetical protein